MGIREKPTASGRMRGDGDLGQGWGWGQPAARGPQPVAGATLYQERCSALDKGAVKEREFQDGIPVSRLT